MTSTVAWEVVPTPRVEKSPVSRKLLQSPVPEKPQPSFPKENVLTKSDLLFIKDLKPTEKSKIALMIQEIMKLEQTCADLRNDLDSMTNRYEKKSELCAEAEDCVERLASENEQLKAENISKDKILHEYSSKLEETSKLLKISSATNKKLQKRLNIKHYCKEVQTEDTKQQGKETQTESPDPTPPKKPGVVEDSMTQFLNKLDSICDKLSAVEREPVSNSEPVLVHNHKTEGQLINPSMDPDITFQAEEHRPIEPNRVKDSVILVREQSGRKVGGDARRYNDKLVSLIDEMEESSREEDELLDDLFFKVK